MENNNTEFQHIPGWGMDVDPAKEPTYPMKNYTGDDHQRISYERSVQQAQDIEILMSNERPAITRVFGSTVPPSGLSGMIRRYAFGHSEDRYRHWIPLILADRINVVEGILADLRKGVYPNMFAERGLKMELKHDPLGYAIKVVKTAVVCYGLYRLLKTKK